jgi:hypothetical protein
VYAKELDVFNHLHTDPVDEDRGVPSLVPLEVHNQLLCFADVEGEVVYCTRHKAVRVPTSSVQAVELIVGNQSYYCFVVSELDDGVGTVRPHFSRYSMQGVQEAT